MPNPTLAVQKVENNFRKMVHDKFVPIQMEVAHLAKKLDDINILTRVTHQNRLDDFHRELAKIIGIPGPYDTSEHEGGTLRAELMAKIKQGMRLLE